MDAEPQNNPQAEDATRSEDALPLSKGSPVHIAVLPQEVIDLGKPSSGQVWIDGTAGAGGHSRLISDAIAPDGRLLAIDRDPSAAQLLASELPNHGRALGFSPESIAVENASYDQSPYLLAQLGWAEGVDGILLDLGLSSDQLADRERGFSFQSDGELDMRFDPTCGEPVWEWLHRADERTIADSIYQYGEERFSRRIAKRIVEERRKRPIRLASELRELIYRCIPPPRRTKGGARRHGNVDPATRTFQALRIVANDELAILESALRTLPNCLKPGGLLLIISFHSLEDRLVKYAFRGDERLEVVTRRPVQATDEEKASNPRSRSAKLRVARRVHAEADHS